DVTYAWPAWDSVNSSRFYRGSVRKAPAREKINEARASRFTFHVSRFTIPFPLRRSMAPLPTPTAFRGHLLRSCPHPAQLLRANTSVKASRHSPEALTRKALL